MSSRMAPRNARGPDHGVKAAPVIASQDQVMLPGMKQGYQGRRRHPGSAKPWSGRHRLVGHVDPFALDPRAVLTLAAFQNRRR